MILFLLFWLGASVGSFLNVCIWRLPRGESVVQPPSHCPRCDTRLQALDLVPLASQLWLRGHCRYCGAKFSWRYFGIEMLTGILYVLVGLWAGPLGFNAEANVWTGDWVRLLQGLIFVSTLVVIFWVDYDTRLIQLESVFLLGLAGVAAEIWRTYQTGQPLTTSLLPGLVALPLALPASLLAMVSVAAVLWLLREAFSWIYKREAMGFGDVMLIGAIAAHLGWNGTIFTFFFLSVVVGAVVGIGLRIPHAVSAYRWAKTRNWSPDPDGTPRDGAQIGKALARHAFRKGIPFGPALAIGGVAALFYGATINTAYLNLFVVRDKPPVASVSFPLPK